MKDEVTEVEKQTKTVKKNSHLIKEKKNLNKDRLNSAAKKKYRESSN